MNPLARFIFEQVLVVDEANDHVDGARAVTEDGMSGGTRHDRNREQDLCPEPPAIAQRRNR